MAVRSFYTDVRPSPNLSFMGDLINGWVAQREMENREARAARFKGGEDPDKLADLELEVSSRLGKLQEAKGKSLTDRDVQAMKSDAGIIAALMGGYNARVGAESRVNVAQIGARSDLRTSNAEAVRKLRAEMGYGSDEQAKTLTTLDSALEQAARLGGNTEEAIRVVKNAVTAALKEEQAGASGPRKDRVVYDAWVRAKARGLDAIANAQAGELGAENGDVEGYMSQRYGNYTEAQQRAEAAEVTRGGVSGLPGGWQRAFDKAITDYTSGRPDTLTEHSERGPDEDEDAEGGAPVRTRIKVKGGGGTMSVERDLEAAANGDRDAQDRIAAAFDAAIADQRAERDSLRKRREAALRASPDGLPTGNVLIDNPNTYVREPAEASFGRAAMAPRESVIEAAVDETPDYHGGFNRGPYSREHPDEVTPIPEASALAPGAYVDVTSTAERKRRRTSLAELFPKHVDRIDAMTDEDVDAMWNDSAVKAKAGGSTDGR